MRSVSPYCTQNSLGRDGAHKGRHPVSDVVFSKQGGGNSLDILLLKDAEVLAQSCPPEQGRNSQLVIHLPVVVLPELHAGDDAVKITQCNSPCQTVRVALFSKICGGEVRQAAGDIDTEHKGWRDSGCRVKLTTAVLIATNPSTSSVKRSPCCDMSYSVTYSYFAENHTSRTMQGKSTLYKSSLNSENV